MKNNIIVEKHPGLVTPGNNQSEQEKCGKEGEGAGMGGSRHVRSHAGVCV